MRMTKLSVNVNKLATLRNSRGKNLPDVEALGAKILGYGAHGLTVHPRPDGRHIRLHDVEALSALIRDWNRSHAPVEFNIEGYPSDEFLALIERIRPDQCTLVPDPPEALTSNAGWDFAREEALLHRVLQSLKGVTRVSLFTDPESLNDGTAALLRRLNPQRIELYTEAYADHFSSPEQARVTQAYHRAAQTARDLGIGVNAGHDLNQRNLGHLIAEIPWIDEVSIGHALICEALEQGLESTVRAYLRILKAE
jgi:pyridoxine 5-phosphate synthase